MTQADNIRPYTLGVKYKILRDVEDAVPYALVHTTICSQNPNLSNYNSAGLHCGKCDFMCYKTANNICVKIYAKNKKQ